MENDAVVADIEAAGRLLTDSISRDLRSASSDLGDTIDNARFATHPYSSPSKDWPPIVIVNNVRELPAVLIERYNSAGGQGTALCGIFPSIRRAWATVDDTLFMWRFDKWDGQCPEYCGEDQIICAVGLAKARPGVFVEAIQYLLVLVNPVELVLLGVCCSASNDGRDQFAEISLQVLPEYTIPTDGVAISCVTTTEKGRIFLGGRDGHLYELLYSTGMGWQKRCRKVCHTAGLGSLLSRWVVPNALKFGAVDAIVEMVIDEERNILYVRTQESRIQVFDLGKYGDRGPRKVAEETRVGDRYGGVRAPAARPGARPGKVTIVSITPVTTTESKYLHLVAIASDGRRIYLSTTPSIGGGVAGGSIQRPSVLRVAMTRPGPPISLGGSHPTPTGANNQTEAFPLKVDAAQYSSGILILSDASAAATSRVFVTTRDLTTPVSTPTNPAVTPTGNAARSQRALRETVTLLGLEGRTLAISDVLPTPDRTAALEASVWGPGGLSLLNVSSRDEEVTRARRLWARGDLATQHILPRRRAVVMSTMGLMELVFNRPVDLLQRMLEANSPRAAIEEFFQRFGSGEAAAMCLLLAASLTTDDENLVTQSVAEMAADAYEDSRLVGVPHLQDGASGGQPNPPAGTGGLVAVQTVQDDEPVFSGAHEGLCLCAARLLRSVWELPIIIVKGLGDTDLHGGDDGGVLACRLPADVMQRLEDKIRSLEQFLRSRRNQRRGLYGRVMGLGDSAGYDESQARHFGLNGHARESGVNVLGGVDTPPVRSSGDRSGGLNKRQRTTFSVSELVAMEVRGTECIRRLLRRSGEALRLLQLLQHHHVSRLAQSLGASTRQQLSNLTFHQLVCSHEGEQIATRLVAALMEYYVAPDGRGTVDDISIKLREGCPSYYNDSDYMFYQAVECLERAASVYDMEERDNLAREALDLLGKVPETADLLSVTQRFEEIRFYEAVVELPLQKARAIDPAEDAFNDSVEESRRQEALMARKQCYEIVTNALRTLKGHVGTNAEVVTRRKPALSARPSLDDAAREKYVRQIVQLGVRWPDRAFHEAMYQTMIELGMENELLELAGADLVPFLHSAGNYHTSQPSRGTRRTSTPPTQSSTRIRQPVTEEQAKFLELLSRYYVRRRQHALAAHVLLRLAERRQAEGGNSLSLQRRFEYLSNAVLQARSATNTVGGVGTATEISDSGLLELLEGKLSVLRFQLKIRNELDSMASKIQPPPESDAQPDTVRHDSPEDRPGAHGLKDRANELADELKSITQLYNDYAVPFEMWEVCLEILNFSNYSGDTENSVMRETWIRLLDHAIRLGGIAEACAVVRRVGPQFYPGVGGSLPLDSLCLHLEKAGQERVAAGIEVVGEEDIAHALLVACKGAAEPVQRTYDRLLASGAILPSPPLRLRMLQSVLHIMKEWTLSVLAQQMGTSVGGSMMLRGGTLSPGQSSAITNGIKDKLRTATNRYMTEVHRLALSASQLDPVSRGFQELEETLGS